jgi:hypothetical protein
MKQLKVILTLIMVLVCVGYMLFTKQYSMPAIIIIAVLLAYYNNKTGKCNYW